MTGDKTPQWQEALKNMILKLLEHTLGPVVPDEASVAGPIDPPKPEEKPVMQNTLSSVPIFGAKSADVAILQKALNDLGAKIGEDSIFGAHTKNAISKIQKANGLAGSGVVGPKTLAILGLKIVVQIPSTGQAPITTDLRGKQPRFIHPELRAMLEERVFLNGVVPQCFHDQDVVECAIRVGRALLSMNIQEVGGNNKGRLVGLLQAVIGIFIPAGTGDPWCKSVMQVIAAFLEDYFRVGSPVLASEHCMTVLASARKIPGLVSESCEVGTMFEFQNGTSMSGHTGLVVSKTVSTMLCIEGNTGSASLSDGDGLYQKTRNHKINGSFTTRGFVRFYPNNKIS